MDKKLLDLPTNKLLERFGVGNHKPGSGSAAALQALLAAELIKTVISLTSDKRHLEKYAKIHPELLRIDLEIRGRIYPNLERLFQEDSDQFDKAIKLRVKLRSETDPAKKMELGGQYLQAMAISTEIPAEIAELSGELANFALFVFEHGYSAVRGDSAVALNSATSVIGGCLAIIELNLLSFDQEIWEDWAIDVRSEVKKLKLVHNKLAADVVRCIESLEKQNKSKRVGRFELALADLRSGRWEDVRISDATIERVAMEVQTTLWLYRDILWPNEILGSRIDVLRPDVVINQILGYRFNIENLGRHVVDNEEFNIAGQIDKRDRVVLISKDLRPEVQNFTAAHELGHALFHTKEMVLHRDRPLDGSSFKRPPDLVEIQANRFATFFLMPAEQVKALFVEMFLTEKFAINDDTIFGLGEKSAYDFRASHKTLRSLSLYLSGVEYYKNATFKSISMAFNVSNIAMAIRLEELGLIDG